MARNWYVVRDGKEQGPITGQQLKDMATSGQLRPSDPIRREDMAATIQANALKGLFPDPVPQAVPVVPAVAVQAVPLLNSAVPVEAVPVTATPASRGRLPATISAAWRKVSEIWRRMTTTAKIATGVGGGCFMLMFVCCGGVSLMSLGGSGGGSGGSGGKLDSKAITLPASDLIQDYTANEVAADQKYKGKTVEVTGKVTGVKKDLLDKIYVTLQGEEDWPPHRQKRLTFVSVQCFFADKYTKEAAALSNGEWVKIRGRCDGKLGNVLLKNCEFVIVH